MISIFLRIQLLNSYFQLDRNLDFLDKFSLNQFLCLLSLKQQNLLVHPLL